MCLHFCFFRGRVGEDAVGSLVERAYSSSTPTKSVYCKNQLFAKTFLKTLFFSPGGWVRTQLGIALYRKSWNVVVFFLHYTCSSWSPTRRTRRKSRLLRPRRAVLFWTRAVLGPLSYQRTSVGEAAARRSSSRRAADLRGSPPRRARGARRSSSGRLAAWEARKS